MKHVLLGITVFLFLSAASASARSWYMATDGSDSNAGTFEAPFATLPYAQNKMSSGDTLWIRGGTYAITSYMNVQENIYACIFDITKSGKSDTQRTAFIGYPGERPVFDLSNVNPTGYRVSGFYLHANYLYLANFDVIGIKVNITTHTQSENVSIRRGNSYITLDNLAIHDGMGIGVYMTKASHVLVKNCDAYNNYDPVSEDGIGGNNDGFGAHVRATDTDIVFYGCRAWNNSDDGYDLINCYAPVTFDHCIAYRNGYDAENNKRRDGNGFKAGGYGKQVLGAAINCPRHTIKNCIAAYNKANGFYANHHLGGNDWLNNTSVYNSAANYCMVNQQSWDVANDVDGYGHVLKNNLAFNGGAAYRQINTNQCTLENNTFLPTTMSMTINDFVNRSVPQLYGARQADGSLPEINYFSLKESSLLYALQIGYQFDADEIMGIPSVAVEEPSDAVWYNLMGQRVDIKASKPGIYIHNGKKILVK